MLLQKIIPAPLWAMLQANRQSKRTQAADLKVPPPWREPPASVMATVDAYEALCTARAPMQRPYAGHLLGLPDHLLLHILHATHAHGALSAATACRSLRVLSRHGSLWTRERLEQWSPAALGTLPVDIQAQPLVRALRFLARTREMIAQPSQRLSDMQMLLTEPFERHQSIPPAAKAVVDEAYDALARFYVAGVWLSESSVAPSLRYIWPHAALLECATSLFLQRPSHAHRIGITQKNALPMMAAFLGHAPVACAVGTYRVYFFDPEVVLRVLDAMSISDDHAALRDKITFIARCPLDSANKRRLRDAMAKRPGLRFYVSCGNNLVERFR